MSVNWSRIALFLSGSFCCGAVNHFFPRVQGRTETPYGAHLGAAGNWVPFAVDCGDDAADVMASPAA